MLRLRLATRQELLQEQRLEIEQRLEQRLAHRIRLKISLEQHLYKEGIIQRMIRWADENNAWVGFDKNGFSFVRAQLPYKIAAPIADKFGAGFAHCHYNPFNALFFGQAVALAKGDWTLFTIPEMLPEQSRDLEEHVALHERGEELSSGDHYFASQLEFASVAKRRDVGRYIKFIDSKCPTKFVDLTEKFLHPLPDELRNYLENEKPKNEQELKAAEKLILENPMPNSVLRIVDKYDSITMNLCKRIIIATGITQQRLSQLRASKKFYTYRQAADIVNEILLDIFRTVPNGEARVVSRSLVNRSLRDYYNIINDDVRDVTEKNLDIPLNFDEAYANSKKNKRLVETGDGYLR